MPGLPIYQQRTQAPSGPQLARINPNVAAQTAQAMGSVGQALAGTADLLTKLKVNERAQQVASLAADSELQLAKVAQDLQVDSDYGTHIDRYQAAVKDLDAKVSSSVKDPAVVKLWRQDFQQQALRRELDVRKVAITGMVGAQKAQLDGTLASFSTLAGEDPENDNLLREKGRLAIETSFTNGVLSPTEAMDMSQRYRSDIISARVRRDISTDPDGTVHKLLTGDYKDLSGEDRAKWIDKANASAESVQRQRLADEERSYRMGERVEKERYEKTAKAGLSLAASTGVTPAWVEANRENLSKDDFKYFYRVATGVEEGPRDQNMYSDLRYRAGVGEDIRDEARSALQRSQLRREDYNTLLNEVEGQYPGWKKLGDQYLAGISGASEANPDPAAPQRRAAMQDEWTQWANTHPKSSAKEARDAYTEIGMSNLIAEKAVKTLILPLPRYWSGTRSQPDLDTIERDTAKALQENRITVEEAAKQATLIQQWREAMTPEKKESAK